MRVLVVYLVWVRTADNARDGTKGSHDDTSRVHEGTVDAVVLIVWRGKF